MKKYLFIIFFLCKNIYGIQIKCNFEEVYYNGEIQQGLFLIKDDNIRYQYASDDLYTIIIKNKNFFLIDNKYKNTQKINNDNAIFSKFMEILNNYPDIKDQYKSDGSIIKIESSNNLFIKRVAIISPDLNVSINFLNCTNAEINKKYFNYLNFQKYNN